MNFTRLFAVVALPLAVFACAVDTDETGRDPSAAAEEDVVGDAQDAVVAKEHFRPARVGGLVWRPGCGVRMPDGRVCYMGLEITFAKLYRDLSVTVRTSVNNTTDVITVKLDTWSTDPRHALAPVMDESKTLGTPRNLQMGKEYTARILSYDNRVLWTGSIRAMPAP